MNNFSVAQTHHIGNYRILAFAALHYLVALPAQNAYERGQ